MGEAFEVTGPPAVSTHIRESRLGWLGGILSVDYPH